MPTTELSKTNPTPSHRAPEVFSTMRDEMNRLFGRFENGWPQWPTMVSRGLGQNVMVPEFDVHDNDKHLTIEADLPGVDEKDVSVTVSDGILTVKGEKKDEREETKDNYFLSERTYGAFERSLRLPDTVDDSKVEAHFDKGVLKIVAEKKPEAVKPERTIEIKKD